MYKHIGYRAEIDILYIKMAMSVRQAATTALCWCATRSIVKWEELEMKQCILMITGLRQSLTTT